LGTTVNNLHVFLESVQGDAQALVARCVSEEAFVSPPLNGWVSVFPSDLMLGDNTLARHISGTLRCPVVSYFCYDSDVSVAELIIDGRTVDILQIGHLPPDDEDYADDDPPHDDVTGSTAERDYSSTPHNRSIVSSEDAILEVKADLDLWVTTLGKPSRDDLFDALQKGRYEHSANHIAQSLMIGFGLVDNRLHMAYRFYERGEDADEFTRFIAIAGSSE
jgi:hypothetical protein